MSITVYTMAFNEELLLPHMIKHYRDRFPNCHIVVYNNNSTDNTKQIAESNNCEVIFYNTHDQVNDDMLRNLKNNCWKSAQTDWVVVCDVDEMLNITKSELINEEYKGSTIITTECWNMVNMEDNYDFENVKHGIREPMYDKRILFNKKHINNINYVHGCHKCNPIGNIKYSEQNYKLYHYKYFNPEYSVMRHNLCFFKY